MLKYKINSPEDVANLLMEDLRILNQERILTVLLDVKNIVLKIVTNTVGSLNASIIEPRDIFMEPIKMSASKVILVHNHPSRRS